VVYCLVGDRTITPTESPKDGIARLKARVIGRVGADGQAAAAEGRATILKEGTRPTAQNSRLGIGCPDYGCRFEAAEE
jgi:hypothetical protein